MECLWDKPSVAGPDLLGRASFVQGFDSHRHSCARDLECNALTRWHLQPLQTPVLDHRLQQSHNGRPIGNHWSGHTKTWAAETKQNLTSYSLPKRCLSSPSQRHGGDCQESSQHVMLYRLLILLALLSSCDPRTGWSWRYVRVFNLSQLAAATLAVITWMRAMDAVPGVMAMDEAPDQAPPPLLLRTSLRAPTLRLCLWDEQRLLFKPYPRANEPSNDTCCNCKASCADSCMRCRPVFERTPGALASTSKKDAEALARSLKPCFHACWHAPAEIFTNKVLHADTSPTTVAISICFPKHWSPNAGQLRMREVQTSAPLQQQFSKGRRAVQCQQQALLRPRHHQYAIQGHTHTSEEPGLAVSCTAEKEAAVNQECLRMELKAFDSALL